jgi:serine/threonine-protein kinase OSR1/STK39
MNLFFVTVEDSIDEIHQEIAIMKELNRTRPQLVTYLSSYVVDSSLWIIMEYLEAGSISDILKQYGPLDEACCAYILKELLIVCGSKYPWATRGLSIRL